MSMGLSPGLRRNGGELCVKKIEKRRKETGIS